MMKLEKKHVRIFSVLIAVIFVGSVVALGLSQMGNTGVASAASSPVGVIDYRQVMSQMPELQEADKTMQASIEKARKDFEEKSKSMNEQQKAEYYQQTQQRLQQEQRNLLLPIEEKAQAAVKAVAEAKGLSVVIEKNAVVYGGQDITQDVIKRTSAKK